MKITPIMAVILISVFTFAHFAAANIDINTENGIEIEAKDIAKAKIDAKAEVENKGKGNQEDRSKPNPDDFSSRDIDMVLASIESSFGANARETSFAQVTRGSGWMTGNNTGDFITLAWVEKNFEDNSSEELRASGLIKISSREAYRLTLVSSDDDEMRFSVSARGINGTLDLDVSKSFGDFTVWTGELDLGNEEFDISVATIEGKSRGGLKTGTNVEFHTKTKFKLDSDVELSTPAQETLKDLRDSLNSVDNKVRIVIEATKESSNVSITSKVEGDLTNEQIDLLEELKDQINESLEDYEGDAELVLEIESDVKAKGPKAGFWNKLKFWKR